MSLNDTPTGDRVHIGFFGRRNAGKSSIVNAVTGQELSVVSETRGTTTDPVSKAMELLPMGPVTIIDTPGFDDEGALGEKRVQRTRQVLNRTDVAVLVVDGRAGLQECDRQLIDLFRQKNIPYVVAWNKSDLAGSAECPPEALRVSAKTGENIFALKEKIAHLGNTEDPKLQLVGDLIAPGQLAVLVIPIDKAAPKGRLILPQQQVLRDILDADGEAICVKEDRLTDTLNKLKEKPAVVITDSQVFDTVAAQVPMDIPLTSFSILMARKKGLLEEAVRGAAAIDGLKDGDKVLISEGCTHHRQCDDIGTVKIPRWLGNCTRKQLIIATSSGKSFPEDLSEYKLVIHCGGCMLSEREVRYRMKCAQDQNIPITNYGIAIAYMKGILRRSIAVFPKLLAELEGTT
jgi:[FeFe] hydrogenase H-cluster maturation GTPase HydF